MPSTLAKVVAFGLIGVLNTGLDWGTFWLTAIVWPGAVEFVWLAKAASYGLGVVSSFVLNSRVTFRREYADLRREQNAVAVMARFVTVALVGTALNSGVYVSLARGAYLDGPALAMATAVSFAVCFTLNQHWAYRAPRLGPAAFRA